MDRLPLDGEEWCSKCPAPATHTRIVTTDGGKTSERRAFCDQDAWLIGNASKRGPR